MLKMDRELYDLVIKGNLNIVNKYIQFRNLNKISFNSFVIIVTICKRFYNRNKKLLGKYESDDLRKEITYYYEVFFKLIIDRIESKKFDDFIFNLNENQDDSHNLYNLILTSLKRSSKYTIYFLQNISNFTSKNIINGELGEINLFFIILKQNRKNQYITIEILCNTILNFFSVYNTLYTESSMLLILYKKISKMKILKNKKNQEYLKKNCNNYLFMMYYYIEKNDKKNFCDLFYSECLNFNNQNIKILEKIAYNLIYIKTDNRTINDYYNKQYNTKYLMDISFGCDFFNYMYFIRNSITQPKFCYYLKVPAMIDNIRRLKEKNDNFDKLIEKNKMRTNSYLKYVNTKKNFLT